MMSKKKLQFGPAPIVPCEQNLSSGGISAGASAQLVRGCMLLILVGAVYPDPSLTGGVYGADDFLEEMRIAFNRIETRKDICVVLGLPKTQLHPDPSSTGGIHSFLSEFVIGKDLIVYFQSPVLNEVVAIRESADKHGLLGTRVFVEEGDSKSIHLAGNLAGTAFVSASAKNSDLA